ncbi:hypothetical protein K435DRAFT_352920 [Dendrothele bispora CBS 962.96]|uniref:Uncharacterized protein n=1 Tax=Dendrothele bispora (strain CBS 962.96) TaxID=1314807 RepID=A0A4S8MIJ6_DENBC|nr:hypothetical protein K435DRAFT_352920 [Dendrothele bispora CBS 962.96]
MNLLSSVRTLLDYMHAICRISGAGGKEFKGTVRARAQEHLFIRSVANSVFLYFAYLFFLSEARNLEKEKAMHTPLVWG